MLNIITELLRQWGVKKLLSGVAEVLRKSGGKPERMLANDLDVAVEQYTKRLEEK